MKNDNEENEGVSGMSYLDDLTEVYGNIYGFKIVKEGGNDTIKPPKMNLPDFVKERIDYFASEMEDGLTFTGAFQAILASWETEEERNAFIKNWDFGSVKEWEDPSDEFVKWRDEFHSKADMQVAVAIIYGFGE